MNYARLILKNLLRNRRRSLLTFSGIILSFFLFVAIFTFLEAFNRFLKSENAQVNLFFRPIYMSSFLDGKLGETYLYQLSRIPLIQHLSPYKVYMGSGRSEQDKIFALGVYPDEIGFLRNLQGVSAQAQEQFSSQKKSALVGIDVLNKNRWQVGDEVLVKGMRGYGDLPIRIVGLMDSKSDFPDIVLVHYSYLKDFMNDGGLFSIALLRVESPYQVAWIDTIIKERFENSSIPVEVISEKGFLESVLNEISSLSTTVKVIAWITLVATLFVAGNTMAMSIRERSMEQGVMRTLGFSKSSVFFLYMTEAVVLAMGGGILGGLIGCLIFERWDIYLPGAGHNVQGLLIRPYWALMKQVVGLTFLMSLGSGLPPAYFSTRRNITETLRFVA